MTTNQLAKIFPQKADKKATISTEILSSLIQIVDGESGICNNGVDYYFKIKLSDLTNPEIPEEKIYEMANSGWVLSKNMKYVELIY